MKHFYLIVLLFGGVCHADTLVAEFAGFGTHGLPDDAPALGELSKTGFQDGDLIRGSFAYQSDAPVLPELEFFPGASVYPADNLRIHFGDTVVEDDDMILIINSGGSLFGNFGITTAKETEPAFSFAIGSPVFSNDLPLSTEDVDASQRWGLQAINVSFDFDSEMAFTISSSPCDTSTAGDVDGDGQVAFSDFLILSDNFGDVVTRHELGDIDCSGLVDFSDFLALSSNFGMEQGVSNVPEPRGTPFGLFVLLLLKTVFGRKRNGSDLHGWGSAFYGRIVGNR
jgi:hypothetical protein